MRTVLSSLIVLAVAACAVADSMTVTAEPEWGLLLHWQAPDGSVWCEDEPLLLIAGQPATSVTTLPDGGWELTWPTGAVATVKEADPGRYEEARFTVNLRNTGEHPLPGTLRPLLSGWVGAQTPAATPEWLVIDPPNAHFGVLGQVPAWFTYDYLHDVAAMRPTPTGDQMLTAVLNGENRWPAVTLPPDGIANYTLHLDVLPGDRNAALSEIYRQRGGYRFDPSTYDFSEYRDPELAWVLDVTAAWISWSWDDDVLDPRTGDYRLYDSLAQAQEEFGGFDVYMFWPFWPRAGFDERFQYDHFRDMPGSLPGLREVIRRCRDELGTRFIIAHCIWSEGDRGIGAQESHRDLVDLAVTLEADGVIMDTAATTPLEVREMARARGRDLMPYAEWDPGWQESQTNLVGRIHDSQPMPVFNLKRYMLPHHPLLRVCNPGLNGPYWERDFALSLFSGHGVEVNHLLGKHLPSSEPGFEMLEVVLEILRTNRASFRATDWQPLIASRNPKVWINEWPTDDKTLYTLVCTDPAGHHGPLLTVPSDDRRVIDLWRQRVLPTHPMGDARLVSYSLDPYIPFRCGAGTSDYTAGCIALVEPRLAARFDRGALTINVDNPVQDETLELWRDRAQPGTPLASFPAEAAADGLTVNLYELFGEHSNEAVVMRLLDDEGQLLDLISLDETRERFLAMDPPQRTTPVNPAQPPLGMLRVASDPFDYTIQHGSGVWQPIYGPPVLCPPDGTVPVRRVDLPPFWIDRHPVTNAQFAQFLDDSAYVPASLDKFLDHWVDGRPPAGKEDHPVVYVDYDDATAYAAWAGKRLPTEEEWQAAAGGATGHPWPWGDAEPSDELCNVLTGSTTPVGAHPAGASPFGVEDLVGNVWQMTAPCYRSTHAQVVFLRGGAWYEPPPGFWFIRGGPRKVNDHHPLPLFGPAMNRLETVGFRCVKDEAAPEN